MLYTCIQQTLLKMNNYFISIWLDTRRKKESKLYPVKIRVYSNLEKKRKLYSTGVDLSDKDFDIIFNSDVKVRGNKKDIKIFLHRIESNAEEVAKNLRPFTFVMFEKKMFRSKDANINVVYHYNNKIKALKSNNQISTASNYDLSLKSIDKYLKAKGKTKLQNLSFYDITSDWLNKYESFMIDENNRSRTTVSMYLRALRTIFNEAISENDIEQETYPFGKGKGKYQIPTSIGVKKALTREQLSILFNSKPQTPEQEKAKDFWFFSYACNGMNIKDIALLKYENLQSDTLKYYRAKTINTKKGNLKEINVFLHRLPLVAMSEELK